MSTVVFCTPFLEKPTKHYLKSLKASVPAIERAGWNHHLVQEIGNPYISAARSYALRKAMDVNPDVIMFIDYDLSWKPDDLVTVLETEGDVVAGTYRYKKDEEEYMGALIELPSGKPNVRHDGAIKAHSVPAGFLKVKMDAVRYFMRSYPELLYGNPERYHVDLFSHGAHKGTWYGEDMAFSRNWRNISGEIWIVPNLDITHWSGDKPFHGNYHEFLLRQPGGSKCNLSLDK